LQLSGKIRGHVPVIAVTANARKDQILRSFDAGMVSLPLFVLVDWLMK
jgi:CheY-like chemotaxis protein